MTREKSKTQFENMSRQAHAAEQDGIAPEVTDNRQTGLLLATTGIAALAPVLGAMAPRGLAPLLVGGAIAGVAAFRIRAARWPVPAFSWLALVSGLILLAAATIAWTPSPGDAVEQTTQFLFLLLPPLFLLAALHESDDSVHHVAHWLVPAYILALVVLAIDTSLGMPLRNLVRGGDGTSSDLSELNRNLTVAVALVWPTALAALRIGARRVAMMLPSGLFIPVVLGESQSAQLGLVAGLVILPCALAAPMLVRRMLGIATIVIFVGIVPFCLWLPDTGPEWLPFSAQHRLVIWQFSAEQIIQHPLFGWGLEASRELGAGHISRVLGDEVGVLPLHPHNAYLQVWLELGLVGAAIALTACLLLIRAVGRLNRSAQPAALAAYASTSAMMAVSYGIWQSWWISTLFLTVILTVVAERGGDNQLRP